MPHVTVNGAQLYYEEHGTGAPIVCIHGTGSAGFVWTAAARKLAALGRVIVYDRRGFTRSVRPEPAELTTVREHTEDCRALLEQLDAIPAVVIGRSYGGSVALDLALRCPEAVRSLVLLEAVPFGLSDEMDRWADALTATLEEAAAERGIDAVGEAMMREALGDWEGLPAELRELFTANSGAILAETRGGELLTDPDQLAEIRVPTLVVSAGESAEVFRNVADVLSKAIPGARAVRVEGGHLIDPAGPAVMAFVVEVLRETARA
ncbi:MAG TPA: alpha/beta hydrolase [Gaiellaceae bacterium]|nr:alpha/beta hydrolase [Gaiellaceae bacterium]